MVLHAQILAITQALSIVVVVQMALQVKYVKRVSIEKKTKKKLNKP